MKFDRAMVLGLAASMTLGTGLLVAQEQTTTHESTTTTTTTTSGEPAPAVVAVPVYNTKHQRHKDAHAAKEAAKADEAEAKADKSRKVRKADEAAAKADAAESKAADPTR